MDDVLDGRTARRNRNRDAVLDAVLELFTEGSLSPGVPDVAERSGVSLRSVYRYFDDTDELIRSAIARNMGRIRPLFVIDGLGEGDLEQRVERIVTSRVRLFDENAPIMRATLRTAPTNEIIREQHERNLEELRRQIEAMFEPELRSLAAVERLEVIAAIDVLLGFAALEHLIHSGCSVDECRRILRRSVFAVLAHPGGPD